MERSLKMDAAIKEAVQDSLPEDHPGHVPNVTRIDREESIWLQILNIRSLTAIQYLVDDHIVLPSHLGTILALKKIQETNKLDEVYAICHEQLGEHDKAKELRDFMARKALEPKQDFLLS